MLSVWLCLFLLRNGLLVDIAGRQRTLIQVMCKEALGIALAAPGLRGM